uniref:Uncharacterized protein n=1 Tax=Aegilops tauschii subsp. strangulata TaxID=200361 RepID=A0A452ZTR2_AEGTS
CGSHMLNLHKALLQVPTQGLVQQLLSWSEATDAYIHYRQPTFEDNCNQVHPPITSVVILCVWHVLSETKPIPLAL